MFNLTETSCLAVVICSSVIFVLLSFCVLILIDAQYLQNVVFSFEMGSNGQNLHNEIFLSLGWRRESPLQLSPIWKTLSLETAMTPKICPKMSNRLIWKVEKVSHHVYCRKTNRGRLFWPPLISLNSVKENRFEQSLGDILPNFFKRVLFFISINLEPVFIEQIKNKADEMLSGWSEVCSYIIGYIYNITSYLNFHFV